MCKHQRALGTIGQYQSALTVYPLQGAAVRLRMRGQGSILVRADIHDSVTLLSDLDAQSETVRTLSSGA